jgi:hypothetical protein
MNARCTFAAAAGINDAPLIDQVRALINGEGER